MADIQHKDIPSADCHEPKHMGTATVADAGKVLTPSAVAGVSELRKLSLSELTGGEVSDVSFTLVDDADPTKRLRLQLSGISAATLRTLTAPNSDGTLALLDFAQTFTNKRINPRVVALTDAATIASNCDTTDVGTVTLTASRTLGNPSGAAVDGQLITYRVRQNGTGTWTLAYASQFRFTGGSAPTITATANKTTYLTFRRHAADARWDCVNVTLDI